MKERIEIDKKDVLTESRNIESLDIDKKSTEEILRIINKEDKTVAFAVEKEIPHIVEAVEIIVNSLKTGGRLFYIGAGTSGRLGIVDAAECPPTFGTSPELVQGIIAGGYQSVFRAQEGAEDDEEMGGKDLLQRGCKTGDVVVGLSTSGRTPYVIGALRKAKSIGARTIAVICNPTSDLSQYAEVTISPITGPEVIMGSTRMKAGTAEKMILNMLSTTAMIKLGKVRSNFMIDMQTVSKKLIKRAKRMIMLATGVDYERAEEVLKEANGNVRIAILMILANVTYEKALNLLESTDGILEKALKKRD